MVDLVWGQSQCQLLGANYVNPSESAVHHVRSVKAQAVMIAPDEVAGLEDPAGLVDFGVTDWLADRRSKRTSSKARRPRSRPRKHAQAAN